jgi:WD40 repeat protein
VFFGALNFTAISLISVGSVRFDQDVLEETHNRTMRSCAWSPNGKLLATANFDSTTAIWEYTGGDFDCVTTLEVNH